MERAPEVSGYEEPDASVFWHWVWDSVRPVLGYILVALGLLALLIGWYGVSGESIVAKQLPYIASGGLLGVALVALGGRFMLIQDLRRDSNRLDKLETMVNELHTALLARPDAPGRAAYTGGSARASTNGQSSYAVLPGGQSFHLPGCAMLEGKEKVSQVKSATVEKRGLTPCPLCEPTHASSEV
ncbi:MAG: hypothetical protein QOG53_581 [Frankiales bacterium]|jgi:hypothetical protein|nr:hypothetical protein [Frankiales bacterium]